VIFPCALTAEYLGTHNFAGLRAGVFFIFFYIFWWCFFVDATQYVDPSDGGGHRQLTREDMSIL
jgi:hypothetical protein